jgi:hypothetical protein
MKKSSEVPDELTTTQPAPLEINHPLATRNQQNAGPIHLSQSSEGSREQGALGWSSRRGNHREEAISRTTGGRQNTGERMKYRNNNADSREVVVLRRPVTRKKIRMKTRVAGPVVHGDVMVRRQLLAFLIRGLHDLGSPRSSF